MNRNHYKIIEVDNIKYLNFPILNEFQIKHCFTTSDIKFHKFEENLITLKCYEELFHNFKMNNNEHFFTSQVHSDHIEIVSNKNNNAMPSELNLGHYFEDCDGLITSDPSKTLVTKFADCTPIVLYDKKNHCVANLHSGWRGTSKKIFIKALQKMKLEFNSVAQDIIVVIGPCIGFSDFEVRQDVIDIFKTNYPDIDISLFYKVKDSVHYLFDMQGIIERALLDYGILENNIYTSDISTYSSDIMHSFRKDASAAGRMILALSL